MTDSAKNMKTPSNGEFQLVVFNVGSEEFGVEILSLNVLLGMGSKEQDENTRIIVASIGDSTMGFMVDSVSEGAGTIEGTVSAINRIVKAAGDVATMVQEIAAAAEEQSVSIEEITASIEDVSAISEESASATQQTSAAAEEQASSMENLVKAAQELAILSDDLRSEVMRLNLGKSMSTADVKRPSGIEEERSIEHNTPKKTA